MQPAGLSRAIVSRAASGPSLHITGPFLFHHDLNRAVPFKSQLTETSETSPDNSKAFLCLSEVSDAP